ncbi:hypothetical protein HUT16_01340 [Kitasatospora sp. NA04385]|uniref:hypothetical protein n=1 Tax=Kitasatospora sp. NA04385 TaxID=2742135 RepID=UPI0015900C66|nr:hypothetical protein [Kitasatospora sp. NA04385]QKW17884.1 hypothetical protein HUT16_01340 [Kitasatospora sp. NA04385]
MEASERDKAREEAARNAQRVRGAVREFLDLATRRRVPLFQFYWHTWHGKALLSRYTRTGLQCVVAFPWNEHNREFASFRGGWAIATDGSFFDPVSVAGVWESAQERGIRDQRAAYAEPETEGYAYGQLKGVHGANSADSYMRRLIGAASALMAPVELGSGMRTGIQPDGWIGYCE